MQLENNSRVAIIGGGPTGSFTALHLQRFAAHAGLRLEIAIFERRDFNHPGPQGCNKCAGILSSRQAILGALVKAVRSERGG